jgi:hypothetical protein
VSIWSFFTEDKWNIGLLLYFDEIEVGLKLLFLYIPIINKYISIQEKVQ